MRDRDPHRRQRRASLSRYPPAHREEMERRILEHQQRIESEERRLQLPRYDERNRSWTPAEIEQLRTAVAVLEVTVRSMAELSRQLAPMFGRTPGSIRGAMQQYGIVYRKRSWLRQREA